MRKLIAAAALAAAAFATAISPAAAADLAIPGGILPPAAQHEFYNMGQYELARGQKWYLRDTNTTTGIFVMTGSGSCYWTFIVNKLSPNSNVRQALEAATVVTVSYHPFREQRENGVSCGTTTYTTGAALGIVARVGRDLVYIGDTNRIPANWLP